jgi:hypothetical protein
MCLFKKNICRVNALILLILLKASMAMAINTATSSGAWETGTNWSSGVAPLATDIVIVPAGRAMTVNATGDVCASLTIAATGSVIINANESLSIGGNFSNAGTFAANAGSTLTFNGAATSTITGGGTYTIAGTVVLNMSSTAIVLDVQDANFISGINSGGNYFISFTKGTWKMDNTGTLNDCYNSGSTSALTISYGVIIESDAGTMNLCKNASTGNAILSGELFMNGGIVNIQTGQGFNSGQDFQYHVNGGTPQLYLSSGTLNIGAGLNANGTSDYIDFHMTGGTMILALNGYSNWITFQLADIVGGKTFMSGGLIILQDACNANIEDIDMGGANVAATQYSVTGGTVQLGYINTQNSSTYYGIDAQPSTNYPNFDFEPGVAKNASAFSTGNINMLSLHVNSNMTFDATGFPNVNIMSNNGTFALDDEGGFIQSTNTVTFSGSVNQLITSTSLANEDFYNLAISNTSGHVTLGVAATVANKLSFTSGILDASNYSINITSGSTAITGTSSSSYIITGNGVATTGKLNINNVATSTSTIFPIGTSTYYLPATINPGTNTGNSYSAFVFQGATTNAMANGTPFGTSGLAQIVNAIWNISRTAGSGNASLTLNWAASGTALEGSSFTGYGLNIGISQYTGGAWQIANGSGSVATETATSTFSSFAQFDVGLAGVVLPISISDFTAVLNNNNTVLLSWIASNEINISDFEVQKSNNELDWKTIGIVRASNNNISESNYSFTDASPVTGANYYRLIIRNVDGTYSYSPVRLVMLSSTTDINIFPNPANKTVNIFLGNAQQNLTARLINQSGQIIQSVKSNSSIISMNVSNYASGFYLVEIIAGDKVIQTNNIIIAH